MDSFPQTIVLDLVAHYKNCCYLIRLYILLTYRIRIIVGQVGTAVTNAFIKARSAVDQTSEAAVETVPIVSTSVAYGVYMAVSSNLRY